MFREVEQKDHVRAEGKEGGSSQGDSVKAGRVQGTYCRWEETKDGRNGGKVRQE